MMNVNDILLIATTIILFGMSVYFNSQFNRIGKEDKFSKKV